MNENAKTVQEMSRTELMDMLARFAGLPPPKGHDQDDWDDWLVASVLLRCRREAGDDTAGAAAAIKLLAPLKFFPQLLPHVEAQLGRGLTAEELRPAAQIRQKKK